MTTRNIPTIRRRAVWGIAGLNLVMLLAGLVLHISEGSGANSIDSVVTFVAKMLNIPIYTLLAVLILSRHPRHTIGWLFLTVGFVTALGTLGPGELQVMEYYSGSRLVVGLLMVIVQLTWMVAFMIPISLVLQFFPNGHLPSRHWWPITAAMLIGMFGYAVSLAFRPWPWVEQGIYYSYNPGGIAGSEGFFDSIASLSFVLFFIGMGGSLIAVLVRFVRASGIERAQMKWLVYAAVIIMLPMLLSPAGSQITNLLFLIAPTILSLAIGIAILRHRLWDIDIIINRTLVYGLLTTVIVGLYVLIVGLLGSVLHTSGNLFPSLLATGLVAVSFQGLRERLQRGVNRIMFGQRDEPYHILSDLGKQLSTVMAAESLLSTVAATIATALKLPYTAITIRQGDEEVLQASHGTAKTPSHIVPLIYQNEQVGQLIVGQRAPGEPLTPADQRVLEDIARQMGAVVHAVRLTSDLQRSRERLVTAREEERRRLRRDLHDELGPTLASHTLKLDAAIDLVETAPRAAIKLLTDMKTQSQALVTDVRRLVYDLRPPALDELGLLATIRSHIPQLVADQRELMITVEAPNELPKLSAAVEVAAYRIAQEAVLNVIKHAGAHYCTLRLLILSGGSGLQIEVIDDGVGLPQPVTSGVGLQSMRERAEELGGLFVAKNRPSRGAQIRVQLPLLPLEVSS
jgi:signal transduction histidine kinase